MAEKLVNNQFSRVGLHPSKIPPLQDFGPENGVGV